VSNVAVAPAREARRSGLPLIRERRFFEQHRVEFSENYGGQFLLIKGCSLIGAYPDAGSAYQEGMRRFRLEPFLVQPA
jgi:hypothetical protein